MVDLLTSSAESYVMKDPDFFYDFIELEVRGIKVEELLQANIVML